MKLVLRRTSLRPILLLAQRGLLASAILSLSYFGFVLLNAALFQTREKQSLDRLLNEARAKPHASAPSAAIVPLGLIGRIEIPRLGVSAIVVEGTELSALRRAAGHIEGTALPGQPGNVGIAGHRDTFFRPLRNIKRKDMITLTTPHGEYRYRVVSTNVVSPSNLTVLNSDEHEILTLVTCYPFYFLGPAPDRFVVRAERMQPEIVAAR